MLLFDYIYDCNDNDRSRLLMYLAKYVSHEIVDKNNNPDTLMKLDRLEEAEKFIEDNKSYFERHNPSVSERINSHNVKDFIKDIAIYFDLKIPYFYFIKKNKISGHDGHKFYKGLESCPELGYFFTNTSDYEKDMIHYNKMPGEKQMATDRQLSYLKALMKNTGYILRIDSEKLSLQQAHLLIGFFKDDKELSDKDFNELLTYE